MYFGKIIFKTLYIRFCFTSAADSHNFMGCLFIQSACALITFLTSIPTLQELQGTYQHREQGASFFKVIHYGRSPIQKSTAAMFPGAALSWLLYSCRPVPLYLRYISMQYKLLWHSPTKSAIIIVGAFLHDPSQMPLHAYLCKERRNPFKILTRLSLA